MKAKRDTSVHVRRAAAALAIAGTFAIAYAGGAAAVTASSAIGVTAVINGQKFENQAVIDVDASANDAYAYTKVRGRSSVPSGHMGVRARLYNNTGALLKQSSVAYNTSAYAANAWFSKSVGTTSAVNGTGYYSQGTSYHWNGSSYVTYTTFQSPTATS